MKKEKAYKLLAVQMGLSNAKAKALIDRRAFDIIQPDVSLCGGIGEVLFISELANLSGVRCYPHCWGADIVIAATVQTLALVPDPHFGLPTDMPYLNWTSPRIPGEKGWRRGRSRSRTVTSPCHDDRGWGLKSTRNWCGSTRSRSRRTGLIGLVQRRRLV